MSPPQEHITGSAWWTDYQPVSYTLTSKRGDRSQFQKLVHSYFVFWDLQSFLKLLISLRQYDICMPYCWCKSHCRSVHCLLSSYYIDILNIMIRHHLQSHGWNRQRNWCSWKFFHTLCISRYLSDPGALQNCLLFFPILIPKFFVKGLSPLWSWAWWPNCQLY